MFIDDHYYSQIGLIFTLFQQIRQMFGWVSRCWGARQTDSQYERAKKASTQPDWRVPNQQDLAIVISAFNGENNEITREEAFNSFIVALQTSQLRHSSAFILKNLLIMDLVVEERIFLNKISDYENMYLLYSGNGKENIASIFKSFISSYFLYIKEKAKLYKQQPIELVDRTYRQSFLEGLSISEMKHEINSCFKIQKLILETSLKFGDESRNPQVIQYIFSSLLKTFLFCYSVVSMVIKILLSRIQEMGKYELDSFYKLAKHFNKEYTNNFFLFIQKNRSIDVFKNIRYNQFVCINDQILDALYVQSIKKVTAKQKQMQCIQDIPISTATTIQVEFQKPINILTRRKPLKLKQAVSFLNEDPFEEYCNFYHQDFQVDVEPIEEKPEVPKEKKGRSFQLKHKLTLYENFQNPSLREDVHTHNIISEEIWEKWQDVFAF